MKKENSFDEIDKLLFKVFEDMSNAPESTRQTIQNAFNEPVMRKEKKHIYEKFQKVAIFIISFTILTTGVVFAKDIVNFITNFFTNSTKAIDIAVENGYVQNVDMDFIIDNNIGIRVNQLIMDNRNLDIAFEYYSNKEDISNLEIKEYVIKDDQDNIIFYNLDKSNNIDKTKVISSICKRNNEVTVKDKHFYESFLITSNDILPSSKKIIIEIKSFVLTNDESKLKETVEGNWKLSNILNNNIINHSPETYLVSESEYISNISTTLNETSLLINIELNTKFDKIILSDISSTVLKSNMATEYKCIMKECYIENNINYVNLKFDISKYNENIDKLNLYVKLDKDKFIDVDLYK